MEGFLMELLLFMFAVVALASMAVAPWFIYWKLTEIDKGISCLVFMMNDDLDGEDGGPDGDDGEPVPRENIVTLARRTIS